MSAGMGATDSSQERSCGDQGQMPPADQLSAAFLELCQVIATLRSPGGCPWDRKQTLRSIRPYTLEETCELLEAIDSDCNADIQEELGDLLLQVVLDAQIATDEKRFTLIEVMQGLTAKMIRRHPHVFGNEKGASQETISRNWQAIKAAEKQERQSLLDGVPVSLPGLARAARLQEKAARVGYDFPHRNMLFDKLREELAELQAELSPDEPLAEMAVDVTLPHHPDAEIQDAARADRVEQELGDVLFVIANIARRWKINPEEALRRTNQKFARRFRAIEQGLRRAGRDIGEATLVEMEAYYQLEKKREKDKPAG